MSGHNPHSRLGQPNASFNHLQVPFIPRQPQLAHVHMNDSILRSSPLNWHQSDAAFLNYMSTQHKTPLDLNPLAFVRPPVANSFGTVDLSFPSHHRHNPSPHNPNSTAANNSIIVNSMTPPLDFPSPLHIPPSKPMLTGSSAPLPGTNSLKELMSNIVNGEKTNGNEKSTNYDASSPNLTSGSFATHQLNDSAKNSSSAWNSSTTHNEPIELIKEKILKNFQELIDRNATTDPSTLLNNFPTTTSATFPGLPNSTINNNTNTQRLGEFPSPNHTSISHNTSRDASNDDSVDSNAGKKQRRRRKPNKTCRLPNNGIDDEAVMGEHQVDGGGGSDVVSNNNKQSETATVATKVISSRLIEAGSNKSEESTESVNSMNSETVEQPPLPTITESLPQSVCCAENGTGKRDNGLDGFCLPVTTRKRRSASRMTSPNELSQDNNSNSSHSPNQRRPGKRKSEADADCETIDKIAAMIASSSPEFNPKNGRSTPVIMSSKPTEALENGNLNDILTATNSETTSEVQPVDQKDQRFEEVEIKLEEMFAGIEDDISQMQVKNPTKLKQCKEVRVSIEPLASIVPKTETKKATMKAKGQKKLLNSSSTSDETDYKPKKPVKRMPKAKTKRGKGKNATKKPAPKGNGAGVNAADSKKAKIKEETVEIKFRGPFVHVKGDGSSNVINAPITEEIAENKAKVKKTYANQSQNDRSKVRGLHVSTLSMKYDASTTDKSWMCVFCKMGPHKFGLGDLFGPYILSTTCEDFELSQVDPADDAFRSRKTKANAIQQRSLPQSSTAAVMNVTAATTTTGNKRKRKTVEPIPSTSTNSSFNNSSSISSNENAVDIFHGMTKSTDTSYEVWMHGDCAVWSSGVHLIGSRVVGLDAAVWSSTRYLCDECHNYGAMLSCFKRGCGDVAHIPCARKAKWSLCDEDFKILCDKHCDKVDTTIETGKGNSS